MRHSRSISDLRADVAENCRTLLTLAEREGLSSGCSPRRATRPKER